MVFIRCLYEDDFKKKIKKNYKVCLGLGSPEIDPAWSQNKDSSISETGHGGACL